MQPGDLIPGTRPQLFYCPLTAAYCCWVTQQGFYFVSHKYWWDWCRYGKRWYARRKGRVSGYGFMIPISDRGLKFKPHPGGPVDDWPDNLLDRGEQAEMLFQCYFAEAVHASKRDDFNGVDFTIDGDTIQVKADLKAEKTRQLYGQVATIQKRKLNDGPGIR